MELLNPLWWRISHLNSRPAFDRTTPLFESFGTTFPKKLPQFLLNDNLINQFSKSCATLLVPGWTFLCRIEAVSQIASICNQQAPECIRIMVGRPTSPLTGLVNLYLIRQLYQWYSLEAKNVPELKRNFDELFRRILPSDIVMNIGFELPILGCEDA